MEPHTRQARFVRFGPFRLDPSERLLFHDNAAVALRPKTLEVLLCLLRRAGHVVSKTDLLSEVWQGVTVSEYVLTTCISELRTALEDDAKRPRYLKTIHRSGYQLLVPEQVDDAPHQGGSGGEPPTTSPAIVGRAAELTRLRRHLDNAGRGQRQVVFITGEMGIGKTTLADELLLALVPQWREATAKPVLTARGQCIDQFGAGEPYMPVFEAIGRLGREPDARFVVDALRRHAPSLLVQIPGLLLPEERIELGRTLPPETQEHLLRLIADGIEALSEGCLLVLLLEDLHLSDPATLELIAALALRRGPARLLLIGTFRSAERFERSSPFQALKQQLLLHQQCDEIALTPLTPDATSHYLTQRLGDLPFPAELITTIHARTEGNPLFLGRLVDHLLEERLLSVDPDGGVLRCSTADIASHVPATLRAMIEQRSDSLSEDERTTLEAASVEGVHFSAAGIAAALGIERERVEAICTELDRRHGLVRSADEFDARAPDLGGRYCFRHALYQQVLYERVEITRRRRLHRSVAQGLRAAWAGRESEVAAELASHLERGGDLATATDLYERAGVATAMKGADREAVRYVDRALALAARGPEDDAGRERELDLLMTRGPSVLATAGYASAEVLANYERALELSRRLGNSMREVACLAALSVCQQTRANFAAAEELAISMVNVAKGLGFPEPVLAQLRNPLGQVRLYQGATTEALELANAAVAAMDVVALPAPPAGSRPALWADLRVALNCLRGAASFVAGRLSQARASAERALAIARELRHPFNIAYAACWAALYENNMGRWTEAERLANETIEISQAYGFPFWQGVAMVFSGHALARGADPVAGQALAREGLRVWRATGGRVAMSMYCNLLADACLAADDVDGAERALNDAEAHATETGEHGLLPETYRLRAQCRRRSGATRQVVDGLLRDALELAQRQGSRLWELRAAADAYELRRSAKGRRALTAAAASVEDEPSSIDVARARTLLVD